MKKYEINSIILKYLDTKILHEQNLKMWIQNPLLFILGSFCWKYDMGRNFSKMVDMVKQDIIEVLSG